MDIREENLPEYEWDTNEFWDELFKDINEKHGNDCDYFYKTIIELSGDDSFSFLKSKIKNNYNKFFLEKRYEYEVELANQALALLEKTISNYTEDV